MSRLPRSIVACVVPLLAPLTAAGEPDGGLVPPSAEVVDAGSVEGPSAAMDAGWAGPSGAGPDVASPHPSAGSPEAGTVDGSRASADGANVPPSPGPDLAPGTAEEPARPAEPSPPRVATELGRTEVRTRASSGPALMTGDLRLELGMLGARPRTSGTALLALAPSVFLGQHGGEGHAPQLFVRGFDAGEGKDLELAVEGVPLNEVSNAHSHGYADTYFIIPELVSGLRVTEGPFLASQGDFAVAGSAQYELGLTRRGVSVIGEYGQFNHQRLTLLWGPGPQETTFIGLTLRQGSGFGPNRGFANGSLLASHQLSLGPGASLRLLAGASLGRFDQAGILRLDDVEARAVPGCPTSFDGQFFCFYDPNQGGAQQRHFASAELTFRQPDSVVRHQLFVVGRDMRLKENFTGFTEDVPDGLDQPLERQRGDTTEMAYGGVTVGGRGAWNRRLITGAPFRLSAELGYLARIDLVSSRSRRLRFDGGAPYRTLFDNQLAVTNLAGYLSGTATLWNRVVINAGLRLDAFLFSVEDRARPTVDRQGQRLGTERSDAYGLMPSPRVAVEVRLVDTLAWSTGLGLGARSSDGAALSDSEFAPFGQVWSAETGLTWRREGPLRVELRGAAFATRVERDIVFIPELARNQPVGPSARVGAFGFARLTWEDRLDVLATASYTRGHLQPEGSHPLDLFAGPALPYVPRALGRVEAVYAHPVTVAGAPLVVTATTALSILGPRPLPLERLTEPVVLLDASVEARYRMVSLGVVVDNVLDTRWRQAEFNHASSFEPGTTAPSRLAARHFAAGAPRQWRLTLGLYLD